MKSLRDLLFMRISPELEVNLAGIAVLSILNQEDHQECNYRASRVDDELPGIRKSEIGGRCKPRRLQSRAWR
jgi:hypothetical protein